MANDHHDFGAVIAQQIGEAVAAHTKSPGFQNQIIGTALKHAGLNLVQASSAYESLAPEQILVQPKLIPGEDLTAIILMSSVVFSKNGYQLLVTAKASEDPEDQGMVFTVTMFVPDVVNTANTQFFTVPEAMQKEILRQLAVICISPGSFFFGMVIVKNFFGTVGVPKKDSDLPQAPEPESVADTVQKATAAAGTPTLPDVEML